MLPDRAGDQGSSQMKIESIIAIYNPLLIRNFIGGYKIQTERMINAPGLFAAENYKKSASLLKKSVKLDSQHWVS